MHVEIVAPLVGVVVSKLWLRNSLSMKIKVSWNCIEIKFEVDLEINPS